MNMSEEDMQKRRYEIAIEQSVDADKIEAQSLEWWMDELGLEFEDYHDVAKALAWKFVLDGEFQQYMLGGHETDSYLEESGC